MDSPPLAPDEREFFSKLLHDADADGDGCIGPTDAGFLMKSGLAKNALSKIWQISDRRKEGKLSSSDFFLALRLIALSQQGRPVTLENAMSPGPLMPNIEGYESPSVVAQSSSDWVISPAERAKFQEIFRTADSDGDGYITGDQSRALFTPSGIPMGDLSRIWTLSDIDQDHKLSQSEFVIAMFLINSKMRGKDIPSVLPLSVVQSATSPEPDDGSATTSPPPSAASASSSWNISPEEKAKYEGFFQRADTANKGYVTGDQARVLFAKSKLSNTELARVWALSALSSDTFLNKAEFVVAMFLINSRLRGRVIPSELPPELYALASSTSSSPSPASPTVSLLQPTSSHSAPTMPGVSPLVDGLHGGEGALLPPSGSSNDGVSREELKLKAEKDKLAGKLQEERARLQAERKRLEEEQERIADLTAELSSIRSEIAEVEAETIKTKSSIEEAKTNGARVALELEREKTRLLEARGISQDASAELEREKGSAASLDAAVAEAQRAIEEEESSAESIRAQIAFQRERQASLGEQSAQLAEVIEAKRAQRSQEESALGALEKEVAESVAAMERQREELAELQKEIEAIRAKRDEIRDHVNQSFVGEEEEAAEPSTDAGAGGAFGDADVFGGGSAFGAGAADGGDATPSSPFDTPFSTGGAVDGGNPSAGRAADDEFGESGSSPFVDVDDMFVASVGSTNEAAFSPEPMKDEGGGPGAFDASAFEGASFGDDPFDGGDGGNHAEAEEDFFSAALSGEFDANETRDAFEPRRKHSKSKRSHKHRRKDGRGGEGKSKSSSRRKKSSAVSKGETHGATTGSLL